MILNLEQRMLYPISNGGGGKMHSGMHDLSKYTVPTSFVGTAVPTKVVGMLLVSALPTKVVGMQVSKQIQE